MTAKFTRDTKALRHSGTVANNRPVIAECQRIRAPRLESGETFILPIETNAGVIDYRVQRGVLENLAANLNGLLGHGLNAGERLRLAELEKIIKDFRAQQDCAPATQLSHTPESNAGPSASAATDSTPNDQTPTSVEVAGGSRDQRTANLSARGKYPPNDPTFHCGQKNLSEQIRESIAEKFTAWVASGQSLFNFCDGNVTDYSRWNHRFKTHFAHGYSAQQEKLRSAGICKTRGKQAR